MNPAMIRPGVGMVVSPLNALIQDRTDALHQNGIQRKIGGGIWREQNKVGPLW